MLCNNTEVKVEFDAGMGMKSENPIALGSEKGAIIISRKKRSPQLDEVAAESFLSGTEIP